MQRGERIIGNLRSRVADRRDQRRLAGVRQAEQAHVGQHLQFQMQPPVRARMARRRLPRRPVGARLEPDVAEATVAALGQQLTLAVLRQVGHQLAAVFVADLRAHRHTQLDVVGRRAILIGTAPALAIAGDELALIAVVDQRVQVAVGLDPDAAAAAAVAAVGATPGDEFFATKRHDPRASVAGGHFDVCFVNELHDGARSGLALGGRRGRSEATAQTKKAPRGGAFSDTAVARVTAAARC